MKYVVLYDAEKQKFLTYQNHIWSLTNDRSLAYIFASHYEAKQKRKLINPNLQIIPL